MEVYLVQHGQAKLEVEDPERPLTEKGKADVQTVAQYIARLGIKISCILHSGRLRARQTAQILAQYLLPPKGVIEQTGLGPLDNPREAKDLILQAEEPLMIVGHLPHLSRLVSLLIVDDPGKEIISFTMGGVVCLGRSDNYWLIKWAVVPSLALPDTSV